MTAASRYWARTALRRRRGAILLVVLVALGAGGAMAAAAGARRTATSDDRLLAISNPPDAFVAASDLATLDAALDRPEVQNATAIEQLGLQPSTVPCGDADESYFPIFVPRRGAFDVPRPRLVEGRFPDPAAPAEALVSEQHAARLGVGVGDPIRFTGYVVDEASGEVDGCTDDVIAEVVVVGVVRELLEIGAAGEPTLAATYLTPAFADAHRDLSLVALFGVGGWVDLAPGEDTSAFVDAVAEQFEPGEESDGSRFAAAFPFDGPSPLEPALDALAVGSWGLAGALALATAVTLAVALVRQLAAHDVELRLLASLGLGRRSLEFAAALVVAVPAGLGLLLAPVVAVGLSTVHLVGLARRVEPEPGIAVDGAVVLAGLLGGLVFVAAAAAVACRAAAARAIRAADQRVSGRPSVATRLARAGVAPWLSMGVGYAFERRRREGSLPGRTALLGVVAGTAGIIGVLVFGIGVGRANDDPSVYGWGDWDATVDAADEAAQTDVDILGPLLADPDIAVVSQVQARFHLTLDGTRIPGSPVEHLQGRGGPTVVRGRLPVGAGEIALGGDTAERLDASIGTTLLASGPGGDAPLRVVGIVAMLGFDGDALSAGWTADRAAVDALGWEPGCNNEAECFTTTAVAFGDGADTDALVERLASHDVTVELPEPAAEVVLLAEADQIPSVAAMGLAAIAAVGLAHAVAATVSRRRRELGVVRALGFDRRQAAGVLVAEGLAVALTGAVLGGLAGAAVGRAAWRAAARAIGIGPSLPGVLPLAVAVVAAVVVLALGISVVPAVRAARLSPAAGLREE